MPFTPDELNQLEQGFREVMDYYNQDTVILSVTDDISLDPTGESRADRIYTDYTLPAQVEYGRKKNQLDANMSGTFDNSDVKILIHLDYLENAGLLFNDYPIFDSETTKITIDLGSDTEFFRCTHVSVEGAITRKQTYCVILGEREEKFR